jgi:membrane protein implicated in regulation of membrane protease activity
MGSDMAIYVYWFLLSLVLLGVEMATGTFYLLVVAIAFAIGGVAALLGLSLPTQLVIASLAGVLGIFLLWRRHSGRAVDAASNSMDAGQAVRLVEWSEDGRIRVFYRGAEWAAEPESEQCVRDKKLYIKEIRGSVLILSNQKPV